MPTNDFKALALGGSNRAATQANYLANSDLLNNGFPTGVVDSLMFNKAFRQSTFIAAVIGQIINDQAGIDALDDGVIANLETGFLRALRRFSTNGMYGVDTGSGANVYQVPYSPAVSAVIDGEVFKFRASHANTGASTFTPNPGTIATAPIWGADHAALGGGEIIANGDVWIQWNSALNGGSGAWVLVDSTGGYIKSPTPAQFDNSQKLATTAFVKAAGVQFAEQVTVNGATVLTAATSAGKYHYLMGVGGYTVTLPAANSVPAGTVLQFFCVSSPAITVARAGADGIQVNSGAQLTGISMLAGDNLTLVSDGGAAWMAIAGSANLPNSALFGASLGSNGYQKLPSGLIIQWGAVSASVAGAAVTFPVASPNATLFFGALEANGSSTLTNISTGGVSQSGGTVYAGSGPVSVFWLALSK